MLPDRVSNPGPLTYESGVLPIALRGPARILNPELFKRHTSTYWQTLLIINKQHCFLVTFLTLALAHQYWMTQQSNQGLHCLPFYLLGIHVLVDCKTKLGLVVQSIVSLTALLRGQLESLYYQIC